MVRFHIQRELPAAWADRLRGQAKLFLTPLLCQSGSASIALRGNADGRGISATAAGSETYTCTIRIAGLEPIACIHPDPQVAIGQAMARARRTLTRHARLGDVGGS